MADQSNDLLNGQSNSKEDLSAECGAFSQYDPLVTDFAMFRGKRIAIFGGSFDPPTRGHLGVALNILDEFDIAGFVFIPAARNPLKPHDTASEGEDRVEMIRAMIARYPGLYVSPIEVGRAGPSYTIDTLREVCAAIGDDTRPLLVIGGDCVPYLPQWRDIESITSLCEIVAHTRPGYPVEESPYVTYRCDGGVERYSSTEVREMLHRGGSVEEMISREVEEVILKRELYRS